LFIIDVYLEKDFLWYKHYQICTYKTNS